MKTSLVIVATSGANYASLQAACSRLGHSAMVTDDAKLIRTASHVILPGVGMAGYAMHALQAKGLDTVIQDLKQPVLGICMGMQLLCAYSQESNTPCLSIFPLMVSALSGERIYPHMGWNQIQPLFDDSPLLAGISKKDDLYFVHNYGVELSAPYTKASCEYGQAFSAYIAHKNFHGVQFHPEKSGAVGERILKNFIEL